MPIRQGASRFSVSRGKRKFGGGRTKRKSRFVKRVATIARAVTLKTTETKKATQEVPILTLTHNVTNYGWAAPSAHFNWLHTSQGVANPDTEAPLAAAGNNRIGDAVNGIGIDLRYVVQWSMQAPGTKLKFFQIEYRGSGAHPGNANFWCGITGNKWLDYIQTDRWKVVRTWQHRAPRGLMERVASNPIADGAGVFPGTQMTQTFQRFIPWKKRVQYLTDNNTSARTQPLFICLAFDQLTGNTVGQTVATIHGTTRFYFKDP